MSSRLLSIAVLGSLGLQGACVSNQPDSQRSQDELQALLHDDPLSNLPPSTSQRQAEAAPDQANLIVPAGNPIGVWSFDDCNPSRSNLADATANGNTAFRAVGVTCGAGVQSTHSVNLATAEDIVYVPDQPSFTLDAGVTVAGWFKPVGLSGKQTLFRKRDKGTSSFALMLNNGKFELIINLGDGRATRLVSPRKATVGVFQHVAGTYDGAAARLYIDGLEVGSAPVTGTIPRGSGPLLIGNDGSKRLFAGDIDNALFATHALTAAEVLGTTCLPEPASAVFTPSSLSVVPAGSSVTIDVAFSNNSPAACSPIRFLLLTASFSDDLILDPESFLTVFISPIAAGTTLHFPVTAALGADAEPGSERSFEIDTSEGSTGVGFFPFYTFLVGPPAQGVSSGPVSAALTSEDRNE